MHDADCDQFGDERLGYAEFSHDVDRMFPQQRRAAITAEFEAGFMASDLRFLFIRDCLRDSLARLRLCWLVLIMAVRGSTRTRMRARSGCGGAGCECACAPGSPGRRGS